MILYSSIPVRNISAKSEQKADLMPSVRKSGRISGQKMDLGHFVRILGQFSGQKRSDLLLTSIKNNIPRPGGKHFLSFLLSDGRGIVAFCPLDQPDAIRPRSILDTILSSGKQR